MSRENRKASVAALHRSEILRAAESLFLKQGYDATTIDEISAASGYSRRTVYAYFADKKDLLLHAVEEGLIFLEERIREIAGAALPETQRYRQILSAMAEYQREYPLSLKYVTESQSAAIDPTEPTGTVRKILSLGTEVNRLLVTLFEHGQKTGFIRKDLTPELSVCILWSGITAFLSLVTSKGEYLTRQFSLTGEQLTEYGFRQILSSVTEKEAGNHE